MYQIQEAEEFNAERRTFFSSVLPKSIKYVTALVKFFKKWNINDFAFLIWKKSILGLFWNKIKLCTFFFTILLYAFANVIRSIKNNI